MLSFIGIGAQKAGTTWLYRQLARHPRVRFPGGKEVHFWDARIETETVDWYRNLFDPEPGIVEGDLTPAYGILEPDAIRQIHGHFPALRVIFIMRNPIARAWSSALMALSRAEMTMNDASDQWFLDHFRSQGSMLRGDYVRTLENWCGVFGDENLLALFHDDIEREPFAVLKACCHFLELEWCDDWTAQSVHERVFSGSGEPLRPSLAKALHSLYMPRIQALETYLGRDLAHWHG